MKTTHPQEWTAVMAMINVNDLFTEPPEAGYGVAFTPTEIEASMIRADYPQLRGRLEVKWEKVGDVLTLYVREAR